MTEYFCQFQKECVPAGCVLIHPVWVTTTCNSAA